MNNRPTLNLKSILIPFTILSILLFGGCRDTEIDTLTASAEDGKWEVSEYVDSGEDETSDFDGYTFDFRADGTVEVIDPAQADHPGTWSVTESRSDDDGEDDIHFNLTFVTADEYLEEITDDWDVVNHTTSTIELMDVSGGDGEIDYLTFSKR